jgi:hypothetical protein
MNRMNRMTLGANVLIDFRMPFMLTREFQAIGVPFLSMAIGVMAKIISRGRKHKPDLLNEFGVGLDLVIAAIVLLISSSIDHFTELNRSGVDDVIRLRLNVELAGSLWTVLVFVSILMGVGHNQFQGLEEQECSTPVLGHCPS